MKRFIAKKLHSSWRWIHRDVFDYDSIRWCQKLAYADIEKPKKYSWIETEKKKWINVLDNSEEMVDVFIYHNYKHNRLDDKIRRFFNLACMNYRKENNCVNVFWQNLCHKYERFVDKIIYNLTQG